MKSGKKSSKFINKLVWLTSICFVFIVLISAVNTVSNKEKNAKDIVLARSEQVQNNSIITLSNKNQQNTLRKTTLHIEHTNSYNEIFFIDGMNWEEWINSNYNTLNLELLNGNVFSENYGFLGNLNTKEVICKDTNITEGILLSFCTNIH